MAPSGEFDVDDFLTELAEVGVGSAILGLRWLNIERRRFVQENPSLEPAIDTILDRIDELAEPVSSILGAVVSGVGDAVEGERGAKLHEVGLLVADMGPELLRLSGFTKRD